MYLSERVTVLTPSVTLGISAKAKQMRKEGRDIINFSAGE